MDLPKRKRPRLKEYDYSENGYYYITINTKDNLPILSNVGRGLAPAEINVTLLPTGIIAEQQLFELESRYKYIRIDKYVIMPTHIHFILVLHGETSDRTGEKKAAGASPRPSVCDIICAYKSLTTRICNKKYNTQGRAIFQTSFYEKIIRSREEYLEEWRYIDENPMKWNLAKQDNNT